MDIFELFQRYYWTNKWPEHAKYKSIKKACFGPKGKTSLGRSPPLELEESPHSGPAVPLSIHYSSQVQGIPDPKGPLLMLGGLVKNPDPKHPTTDVTSTTGVLEAKKMIARYCLLSWTMCYNTFNNSNNNKGFISKIKSKCKRCKQITVHC